LGGRSRLLSEGDAVGEALKLIAAEDFGIDHADEQRLDRALAEPVDDALDGAAGDTLAGLGGTVEEGPVFDGVSEIALLFKTAQDGADGGVLKGAAELFADLLGGDLGEAPDDEENGALKFAEFGGIVTGGSVTRHSVTYCSI
jgi:hypothetical protein